MVTDDPAGTAACDRCEAMRRSYELKVQDLARETRRVSAALAATAESRIKSPRHIVGEAAAGWDAAMDYVRRRVEEVE